MNELTVNEIKIENMIYEIRGKQVMLDSDLAKLYECVNGTKTINQAVSRHKNRFPERFMFQITKEEYYTILRSQTGTLELQQGKFNKYLPGAYSIGDILKKEGYNQELLLGSKSGFGNRNIYFKAHGNYKVYDYNTAIKNKKIAKDYYTNWGFEDSILFDIAKEEITKLSKEDEPFNFVTLTTATHFPDGYVEDSCMEKYEDSYSNSIDCSSSQIKEFIEWIKKQDFYDDTTIVISGDHLTMQADFFDDNQFDKRTIYNLFINSAISEENSRVRYFTTMDMYELNGSTYFKYYIKGKINKNYIYFVVDTDTTNQTFDIFPISEEVYNQDIEKVVQTEESQEKSISKKTYNFYKSRTFSDEDLCRLYYTNYIKLMLTDTEEAYKMLNEDYKKLKFGSIDNFNKYIQANKKVYESIYKVETVDSTSYKTHADYYNFIQSNSQFQMKSFAVNNYDEYTQCLCGNITASNYIFNVKYPGEYEAFLDSYTIDIPVFTEKYNNSTNENKVALNLEKIRGAINTKDYRYVYEKLDETFRNKNFGSLQKFTEYMQNNFFEYNDFGYKEIKQEGKVYTASFEVNNTLNKEMYADSYNVIMRLDEDNKFVFSFSKQ